MIFQNLKLKFLSFITLLLLCLLILCIFSIFIQHFFMLKFKNEITILTTKIEKLENDKYLLDKNIEILQKQIFKIKEIERKTNLISTEILSSKDKENAIKLHNKMVNSFNKYSSF